MSNDIIDKLVGMERHFEEGNPEREGRLKALRELKLSIDAEIGKLSGEMLTEREDLVKDFASLSFADINNMRMHGDEVKKGNILSSNDPSRPTRWNYRQPVRTHNIKSAPISDGFLPDITTLRSE